MHIISFKTLETWNIDTNESHDRIFYIADVAAMEEKKTIRREITILAVVHRLTDNLFRCRNRISFPCTIWDWTRSCHWLKLHGNATHSMKQYTTLFYRGLLTEAFVVSEWVVIISFPGDDSIETNWANGAQ